MFKGNEINSHLDNVQPSDAASRSFDVGLLKESKDFWDKLLDSPSEDKETILSKELLDTERNPELEFVGTVSESSLKETKDFWDALYSSFKDNQSLTITYEEGETDQPKEYYTEYSERLKHTPVDSENGHWEGERGESKYIPSPETEKGRAGISKLAEYDMDGIEYRNCEPDYSDCSEGTVQIDNMSENRPSNFSQADIKLSEQWNAENREGRSDWTDEDVENYRKENNLSWHECCDTKTMNLVSRDIHGGDTSVFLHSGGVAECKVRDNTGGGFDE